MRSLILFRHGKSEWNPDVIEEGGRGLSRRGRRDAAAMGQLIRSLEPLPDQALVSPARRARDTISLAMEHGGWTCPIENDAAVEGDVNGLTHRVQRERDSTTTLLVVGHEPTLSGLTSALIGGGRIVLPTAAMVRIDLEVHNWSQVGVTTGQLVWLVTPRVVRHGMNDEQRARNDV